MLVVIEREKGGFGTEVPQAINDKKKNLNQIQENIGQPLLR